MNSVATSKHFKILFSGIAAVFLIVAVTGNPLAQEAPPPIPDGAKKLQAFVGNWEGDFSSTEGGEAFSGKIFHTNKSIAEGWGIEVRETAEIEGTEPYNALNMFGYDIGTGLTHLYTVDNYAGVHDHKGQWADEKTLNLQHDGTVNGKPYTEKIEIVMDNPSQYHFTVERIFGGELAGTMQATMRKKK